MMNISNQQHDMMSLMQQVCNPYVQLPMNSRNTEAAYNIKLEVEHELADIINQTLDAQYQDM